jgi:type I restriction enzyme, S subunit
VTQTVLLGDICDVRDGTHDSPKPKGSGRPLVTSKHIKNHKIDLSSANLISEADFEAVNRRSKVDKNDILISMIGTVGELAFIDYEPTFAIKNIGLIKTGNELFGRYLFYYLQGTKAKRYLEVSLAGSTQKFISLGLLRKFPIDLPGASTQAEIVNILGTIDEKIDLNRKMNETLEQIGYALFRHYFVENPEAENWEEVKLSDISSYISRGISPTYDNDGTSLVVNQRCIRENRLNLANARRQSKNVTGEKLLRKGDVLINSTGVGTLGRVAQVDEVLEDVTFDSHVTVVRPAIDSHFFGQLMRNLEQKFEDLGSGTTGQTELSRVAISEVKVKLPPKEKLTEFGVVLAPFREKMHENDQQIQTLITLHDTTLPRLISGVVRV